MKRQDLNQNKLPNTPGVYLFKNGKQILYIGKATSLRDRVWSYFSSDLIKSRGMFLVDMIQKSKKVDFIKTDSVLEALILEAELIKKYQPKYNTKEKDNKSFNYVCITKESVPKVLIVRGRNLKKENYKKVFGPFTNGSQLREAMKIIRRIFPYFDAQSIKKQNREFYYQLGLVPDFKASQNKKNQPFLPSLRGLSHDSDFSSLASLKSYKENIKNLILFFQGKKKNIIQNLKKEMGEYAKFHEFERATEIKKRIFALGHINDVALIKEDVWTTQNEKISPILPSLRGLSHDSKFSHFTAPTRIEAYDVAHMSGKNIVGVMTVIEDGEAEKSEYKKFIVRSVKKSNDPASLAEILSRRLKHKEWPIPNFIVVDGNNIQKNVAQKILREFDLKIPVIAVTKNERHKPKAVIGQKNIIDKYKKEILLANSEAHRFAIKFYRQKSRKNMLK